MSAVSKRVMPRSSALWTTLREASRSIRPPKLLQPSPTSETSRPDVPRLRCFMPTCRRPLIHDDRADRLAARHQVEALVDALQRQLVGDQRVDLALAVHVPVDDLRHVGAAARAAEGRALPDAAGDELEGPRRDLLAGAGDADDDRDAPALVAALQRLAHQRGVADAFEAVIGAALGQVDEIGHEVARDLLGIDEMRHAEALGERLAAGIDVDADDHVGAGEAGALDDVEADAAEAEDDDIGARLDLGGVDDGADAGGDAAADIADLVEGRVLADP